MVESRTARMRLVQWSSGTDSPQRVDFNETFLNIETLAAIDQQGTLTDRPAASKTGMYYFATDQGTLYRSDGLSWAVVGASVLSQFVRPARTDAVAQTVQGLASQTADLQRVIASTNTIYQRVQSNGDLIHGPLRVSQAASTATSTETVPTDSAVTLDNNSTGMWGLSLLNTTGNTAGFFRAVRGGSTVFSVSSTGVVSTPMVTLSTTPTVANHVTTKAYVDTAVAGRTYALTSSQLTGVLPVAKGGTGGTTEATARDGIGAAAAATTITVGPGLTGGGDLSANRTINVNFPTAGSTLNGASVGSSSAVARYDHSHALEGANIVGILPAAQGGTGVATLASGSYVIGNGTSAVTTKTPAQVLADIDGATSGHGHALTDANITGTLPLNQGGTGATNAADARTNLQAAYSLTTISAGAGLMGGGNIGTSRTLSVSFAGTGSASTVSRSDHTHEATDITTRLTSAQLPKMGGLGSAVDLNDYVDDGEWVQTSSANASAGTNYPASIAGYLRVVSNTGGSMVWQKYTSYANSDPREFVRTRYNGTWGAWVSQATRNDISALSTVYAPRVHGHALTDANITGTLSVAQGGTGSTTATAARTALDVPVNTTQMIAGAGLSGGGDLTANRTFQVVFEGSGSKSTSARSDHGHALTDANITGTLPVVQGGTGLTSLATDAYLTGNGTGAMTARTPASVLSHIGAAASGHGHALTDSNITGTLPINQGGTGATTQAAARTALAVPSTSTAINTGAGLTGGGNLTASRTLAVSFAGTGSASTVARSDHSHQFSDILGSLGFTQMPDVVALGSSDDLNTYTTPGDYVQPTNNGATSGTNYPTAEAGRLFVRADRPGSTVMSWQIYITYTTTRPKVFVRTRYNSTWGAWKRLLDDVDYTELAASVAALDGAIERSQRRIYRHYPASSFVLEGTTASTTWLNSISGGQSIDVPAWATHAVVRGGLYQGYTNIKGGTSSGTYWGQVRLALGPYAGPVTAFNVVSYANGTRNNVEDACEFTISPSVRGTTTTANVQARRHPDSTPENLTHFVLSGGGSDTSSASHVELEIEFQGRA